MKLTKLLMGAVLAVAAMTFVACEPDKPEDKPAKEYAFELKSEATLEFPAEGGEGVIEWALNEVTRNNPNPAPEPTLQCDAEWIVLSARHLGAFEVHPNEGEAREAIINIEY
ncbi:MAG: BACON domain-containing protein, partial [Alistipes sp.]|nr:BACON domain-containing protein [Alistipes sp.]